MTPTAWVFLSAVWSMIIGATSYCFWKLLSAPRRLGDDEQPSHEHHHHSS